jgi:hypothetical protein
MELLELVLVIEATVVVPVMIPIHDTVEEWRRCSHME